MHFVVRCQCGCFRGAHARKFSDGRNDWRGCYRCPCEQYAATSGAPGEDG